jgi:drug/metabolite transporter (DMT)-like permease
MNGSNQPVGRSAKTGGNILRLSTTGRDLDMGQNLGWIFYALASTMALAAADVFIKLAAGRVSNSVGVLVYGGCTFSMGLAWFLWQRINGVAQHVQTFGLLSAVGVGVSFCLVTAGLYATFEAGAPISLASPLIRLGGLLIASAVGLVFWHELLTLRYALGVALVCGGVYLIITR